MGVGALGALAASPIMRELGIKRNWLMAALLLLLCYIFTGLLSPTWSHFGILAFTTSISAFGAALNAVTANTILASIADYGQVLSRQQNAGGYFSIYMLLNKTFVAI